MTDKPAWATEEVCDDLAEAISESLDIDWEPSWSVPYLIPVIDRLLAEREAETIERCAKVAAVPTGLLVVSPSEAWLGTNIAAEIRSLLPKGGDDGQG
jgi:hypothetical protein